MAGRTAVGNLLRLGFLVLPCCVFAGLRRSAKKRLMHCSKTRVC